MTQETQDQVQVAETAPQKVEFRFRERDGYKRPTLEVNVPLPTIEGIKQILSLPDDSKTKAAVIDAVNGVVVGYLRGLVNADENFSQENVDKLASEGALAIETIANLGRSERNTITNADLAAFAKVFIEVAAAVEGDKEKRIASAGGAKVAADAFTNRIRGVEGKNDVLGKLEVMLTKFTDAAEAEILEAHAATVEWLYNKIEDAKKKDEITLDNLD